MKKKLLCLTLALAMLLGLVACGNNNEPADANNPDAPPADTNTPDEPAATPEGFQPLTYDEDEIYDLNFTEFLEYYDAALVANDTNERWAKMAIAEAKLLESGLVTPGTTRGGNYGMRRIPNRTVPGVLYGNDNDRFYTMVVTNEIIKTEHFAVMNEKWEELKGTGTYIEWLKGWLTENGYTMKDSLGWPYGDTLVTWDILATSQAPEAETLVHTIDGLMEYDNEDVLQPSLAVEAPEVSADGLVYTFKLRNDVVWSDSQGREVAKLTADDFVAGMQHLMDAGGGLETLLSGVIKGATEYINGDTTDFATVGVKALDEYTVEYTLEKPVPYLMTMLGYSIFFPMSRSYYESQGGKFGQDFDPTASDYTYGTSPDHIAYCGPFLITSDTPQNSRIFEANPNYYKADKMNIHSMTWVFEDGTDVMKQYEDFKNGLIDSTGLVTSTVKQAREEGIFDLYARVGSTTAGTWYNCFNLNRRAFANYNDDSKMVSTSSHASVDEVIANGTSEIEDDASRAHVAMNNKHFRLSIAFSLDRGSLRGLAVGEELKYNSVRNTYVPGSFVTLQADTTVDINGTATTFPAGTQYGEIIQAQLTADNFPAKVWDMENGADDDHSVGFDGWYNVEAAKAEWAIAKEELAAQGLEISAENPIYLDLAMPGTNTVGVNQANLFVQCIETALGGEVVIRPVLSSSDQELNDATYYNSTGAQLNTDCTYLNFGWNPDWGDPNNYLDQLIPGGYMVKGFGIYS